MTKRLKRRIKNLGVCRGDGSFYAKLEIEQACKDCSLIAVASCGETSFPASLFPTQDSKIWILQVPVLDVRGIVVEVFKIEGLKRDSTNGLFTNKGVLIDNESDGQSVSFRSLGSVHFNYQWVKWESRINYRVHASLCAELRDYELTHYGYRYQPQIMRYFEGENADIWRIRVVWQGDSRARPCVSIYDGQGHLLDVEQCVFEYQRGSSQGEAGVTENALILSLELPKDQRSFYVVASPNAVSVETLSVSSPLLNPSTLSDRDTVCCLLQEGFCAVNLDSYNAHKNESRLHMADACADPKRYQQWFEKHRATAETLDAQRSTRFCYEPLISLIVPCFDSNRTYLKELFDSVRDQSYSKWELVLVDATCERNNVVERVAKECFGRDHDRVRYLPIGGEGSIVANTNHGIEHAQGEYIAFLDHDDLLEPDALYCYVDALTRCPEAIVFYCDEDAFRKKGHYFDPSFKSKLNPDLLYSHNCVMHFLMVKRAVLLEIGLSDEMGSEAQDYDLTLKMLQYAIEKADSRKVDFASNNRPQEDPEAAQCGPNYVEELDRFFAHVPRMLYHSRVHLELVNGGDEEAEPHAEQAGLVALRRHLDARGLAATVEATRESFVYRVRYWLPDPHPQVSIIIPSKDHVDVLDACLRSIVEKSTYDNYEIIVVENNSTEPQTFAYYDTLSSDAEYAKRVSLISWTHEFNYSKIVNYGAQQASGEYLLFLNNDTEVITPGWIEEMLGYLQRPEVGVVGAKLYFRDQLTQHAGMMVGPYDAIVHVNQDFTPERPGYLAKAIRPGNFSSVTGACQMVPRKVFDEVGGYDEAFEVGFNDADFCLRVQQAGYYVTYTPYAELFHYEFVSRGRETADSAKQHRWERERDLFMSRWPEPFEQGDPFGNPNLKRNNTYYALGD